MPTRKATEAYIDGASRGNPGESGIGVLIISPDSKKEKIREYLGRKTNNEAEYAALIKALGYLKAQGVQNAKIHTDSKLVANQMNRLWAASNPRMKALRSEAKKLAFSIPSLEIQHIPREENAEANRLANQAVNLGPQAKPRKSKQQKAPTQKATEVYIDGASRGNPGESGIGVLVISPDSKKEKIREYLGRKTNNEAEYAALIKALGYLKAQGVQNAKIHTDSKLVANQMNGLWAVRNPRMKILHSEARKLASSIPWLRIRYIPRKRNAAADRLANEAINRRHKAEPGESKQPVKRTPKNAPPLKVTEVYIDGASRGNPGESGIGILIINLDSRKEKIREYLGRKTNNEAEYAALIKALGHLKAQGVQSAIIRTDSQLVANQMNGIWKVKNPRIEVLRSEAKKLASSIPSLAIRHIPREENIEADRLANEAIDNYFTG